MKKKNKFNQVDLETSRLISSIMKDVKHWLRNKWRPIMIMDRTGDETKMTIKVPKIN